MLILKKILLILSNLGNLQVTFCHPDASKHHIETSLARDNPKFWFIKIC